MSPYKNINKKLGSHWKGHEQQLFVWQSSGMNLVTGLVMWSCSCSVVSHYLFPDRVFITILRAELQTHCTDNITHTSLMICQRDICNANSRSQIIPDLGPCQRSVWGSPLSVRSSPAQALCSCARLCADAWRTSTALYLLALHPSILLRSHPLFTLTNVTKTQI